MMFNPRYAQLLQQKGLNTTSLNSNLIPTANPIARTLSVQNITPQTAIRRTGFGTHFADTPPPFIAEVKKVDNKIERRKKPKPKKKKRKSKNKKSG
tara:strand:+ start:3745 stop:4032 length:288 start_codon:yes stop_codon:yes gene_type:complete